jgi:hypothetical protein
MSRQLKTVSEILTETWRLYTQRAVPILAVIFLTTVLIVGLVLVVGLCAVIGLQAAQAGDVQNMQFNAVALAGTFAAVLLAAVLIIWSQAASLAVTVDNDLGIMGALKAGWKYFIPLAWVGSLYMGIVMTGLTLFLVPGLILGMSMSLCFYIMFDEDLRGMDAVLASRHYVRGRWWNTFGKFCAVWLLSAVTSMVPFIGQILSFLFTPFLLLYMVVVYRDLRETADPPDFQAGSRWLWSLMAAVGIIVPLLGLLGGAVTLAPQLPELIKKVQQGEVPGLDLQQLEQSIQASTGVTNTPPAVTRLKSVDGSWIWRDPTGDTASPLLDVKEVSVKSEDSGLLFNVTLAKPIAHYFAGTDTSGYDALISLYLDTDVNRETGGSPFADSGRAGYDFALDVVLETQLEQAETDRVQVALYALDGSSRKSLGIVDEGSVTVTGSTLKIRLPFAQLGVGPDDTVRICFREVGQQQGSGLAKDKLIPLQ